MSAPIPFTPPRPIRRNPAEFLEAMATIGASAVLVREGGMMRLDFAVPVARQHRASVILGDRSTWSDDLWIGSTALAVLLTADGGTRVFDHDDDEAYPINLAGMALPSRVGSAALVPHRLGSADVGTPAALFRALRAIGGEVVIRRDRHGLGLGFAATGRRELRLDVLLGSCTTHDGDWWLEAIAETARLFPMADSPWTMRLGEVRRLRLTEAVGLDTVSMSRVAP